MELICLGLNHTTAPLSVRERVAFGPTELSGALQTIRQKLSAPECGALSEVMILSTCNRTEIYAAAESSLLALSSLCKLIESIKGVTENQFEPHTYQYVQAEAARHVYRVVSGIDSMVLGETQIVGQFKKAVEAARSEGTLGVMLNHVFQEAFAVAKNVRSSTAIGSSSVSLAAAAVRLSLRLFGTLTTERILFVGAGEMIELCAAHFCAQKPLSVTVANRTLERGQALADQYGGTAMRLQDLPAEISKFDIIVSCTASSLPIIGLGMIKSAIKARRHRPMCLIDLAVPRDIEAEIAQLSDVYVYSMDELGAVVQSGKESRRAAVLEAESIISTALVSFENWLLMRASVPVIAGIRSRADGIRAEAVEVAMRDVEAGVDIKKVLEKMSISLMNKLTHDVTVLVREAKGLSPNERQHLTTLASHFYEAHRR